MDINLARSSQPKWWRLPDLEEEVLVTEAVEDTDVYVKIEVVCPMIIIIIIIITIIKIGFRAKEKNRVQNNSGHYQGKRLEQCPKSKLQRHRLISWHGTTVFPQTISINSDLMRIACISYISHISDSLIVTWQRIITIMTREIIKVCWLHC